MNKSQRKQLAHLYQQARHVVLKLRGKKFIHFLHIGKTGGSAIKFALEQYPADPRYFIYLHPHRVRLVDVPVGEKFIFLLRDPVSRFVSGFYSRQREGKPLHYSPWKPDEKIAFDHFLTANQLALAIYSNDPQEAAKAQHAMQSIGHVRQSYWYWFKDEAYFRSRLPDVFFIGFQESLNQDFERLKQKLGMPADATLPADELHTHKNPNNVDKKLEDKAIDNLKRWYKADYEFIQLCRTLAQELP